VHVTTLAAGGLVLKEDFCDSGSLYRVRDADRSCLAGPTDSSLAWSPDTIHVDLRKKSTLPSLLVMTQGRALDWLFAPQDSDLQAKIPSTPMSAAGASVLLVAPSSHGWSGWRQSLEHEQVCTESRFPLAIETSLPAIAKKGTPLPPLRVVARTGRPSALTVSLRLVPDEFAASLKPLCRILGRAWASSEVYTGDAPWNPLGLGETDFQNFDQRRDPDPFVRLGMRPLPPLCIACGPWVGSWEPRTGKADLPSACGWTSQDLPCLRSGTIPAGRFLSQESSVDSAGTVRSDLSWPKWPGSWRLQAWGIDSLGRVLAWERRIRIE
jgi:hypothetical protein